MQWIRNFTPKVGVFFVRQVLGGFGVAYRYFIALKVWKRTRAVDWCHFCAREVV